MANKIQLRRGLKSKLPSSASAGEPLFATDSREIFMGTGNGSVNMTGSHWYTGTAMSGTSSTAGAYYYADCPEVKVGDYYLNTSYGYVYECVTAGSGTTARWTYKGSMRGPQGGTGGTGPQGTRGTRWNVGTACTGTSTSNTQFSTGISDSIVGDMYLNTSTGNVYKCTTAGASTTARWVYVGTIKGSTGQRGSKWYTGTAMSGTSTSTGAYTWNDSEQKYVGDMYLNTTYGYVYKCTTAGTGTTAKWTYQDSIKGKNGKDGQDTANYINTYGTSGSWKAVYTNGGATFRGTCFGDDGCTVVLEGMSKEKTTFTFYADNLFYCNCKTIVIKNSTVLMSIPKTNSSTTCANFVFIDCLVQDDRAAASPEMYFGNGSLCFINCDIVKTRNDIDYACTSGISTSGDVTIIGGTITVDAGGTTDGYDSNFIYSCNNLIMQGVKVETSGASSGRINVIRGCNRATVTGCIFYLTGSMHSIGHIADTDRTVVGSFTGNYVEYYKTYMRFGTISGNEFCHMAAGSASANQIVLQCPTCMTGNQFTGFAAYVDAQSQKVIVDRNLHDNGLTVGSAGSGSITTNNLQY